MFDGQDMRGWTMGEMWRGRRDDPQMRHESALDDPTIQEILREAEDSREPQYQRPQPHTWAHARAVQHAQEAQERAARRNRNAPPIHDRPAVAAYLQRRAILLEAQIAQIEHEMEQALWSEILYERRQQDAQWGGPDHDDQHDVTDWSRFMIHQQMNLHIDCAANMPHIARSRLVKIAALAVAAIQSFDRKRARGEF